MGAKKRAVVKFHRDLYPERAVKAAAVECSALARIRVRREGAYLKAVITADDGAGDVAGELSNLALFNLL